MTMLPNKARQTTRTMILHDDVHYHDHDIYHHAPNGVDGDNGRTDFIYDNDK